jgi:hypothetical protein
MERSELINTHRIKLHDAAATLPAPTTVAHGGDISSWRMEGRARARKRSSRLALILIDGGGTLNLTASELLGWDDGAATPSWRFLSTLNGGSTISLATTRGFASRLIDVGLYGRLAVQGTLSASTVTVWAVPVEMT